MELRYTLAVFGTVSALLFMPILQQKASAQNLADPQTNQLAQAICYDLNSGRSFPELAQKMAIAIDSEVARNRLSPEKRNEAAIFFSNLTNLAVSNYCPVHIQALIEIQSASAPGYQAPSKTCNFNIFPQSPNNSTYANAANAWGNWFNNFGGKWMPRITGQTTQQLYGC
jgi:hypothetical protein